MAGRTNPTRDRTYVHHMPGRSHGAKLLKELPKGALRGANVYSERGGLGGSFAWPPSLAPKIAGLTIPTLKEMIKGLRTDTQQQPPIDIKDFPKELFKRNGDLIHFETPGSLLDLFRLGMPALLTATRTGTRSVWELDSGKTIVAHNYGDVRRVVSITAYTKQAEDPLKVNHDTVSYHYQHDKLTGIEVFRDEFGMIKLEHGEDGKLAITAPKLAGRKTLYTWGKLQPRASKKELDDITTGLLEQEPALGSMNRRALDRFVLTGAEIWANLSYERKEQLLKIADPQTLNWKDLDLFPAEIEKFIRTTLLDKIKELDPLGKVPSKNALLRLLRDIFNARLAIGDTVAQDTIQRDRIPKLALAGNGQLKWLVDIQTWLEELGRPTYKVGASKLKKGRFGDITNWGNRDGQVVSVRKFRSPASGAEYGMIAGARLSQSLLIMNSAVEPNQPSYTVEHLFDETSILAGVIVTELPKGSSPRRVVFRFVRPDLRPERNSSNDQGPPLPIFDSFDPLNPFNPNGSF